MEGSNARPRGRGHFGLLAALREFRLSADLCPADRAQATNPGRRGPLRSGDPGRLAGGRARRRAAVQGRHDRDSVRGLQAARAHLYARVLPAVGGAGTRMPARAWPPADRRTAPTGAAPRGPDWAPAGAGRAVSRRPGGGLEAHGFGSVVRRTVTVNGVEPIDRPATKVGPCLRRRG